MIIKPGDVDYLKDAIIIIKRIKCDFIELDSIFGCIDFCWFDKLIASIKKSLTDIETIINNWTDGEHQ